MSTETSFFPARPIKHNKCQAHGHEYKTQCCETHGLDLWSGFQGFTAGRDDANVEESRKDEDQTGSSSCPSNAKDVSDVGDEDDQQVDSKQQTQSDGDVTEPVEGFPWEQQLQQSSTDREQDHRYSQSDSHQDSQPHT